VVAVCILDPEASRSFPHVLFRWYTHNDHFDRWNFHS
jgi:hypothetical protein